MQDREDSLWIWNDLASIAESVLVEGGGLGWTSPRMFAGRMLGILSSFPEDRTKNFDIGTGVLFLHLEIFS